MPEALATRAPALSRAVAYRSAPSTASASLVLLRTKSVTNFIPKSPTGALMDTTASCPDGPGGTGTGVESHRPAGSFGLGGALAAGDSLVAVEPLGAAVVGVVEVAVALGVLFFDPPATAAIMMMRTTTPTPSPIQRP